MKIFLLNLGLLVMLTCFASCGKKAKVKDSNPGVSNVQSTEDQGYILKDLKTAVLDNDIQIVKKIISSKNEIDLNQIIPGTGETLLTLSIIHDFREIRNFLLEKGVNPEALNGIKQSPLFVAVKNNQLNSAKVLIDLKVDMDAIDMTSQNTPLIQAIKNANKEMAIFLIKEGANLETLDKNQRSPIRLAEDKNLSEVTELIRSILQAEYGAPDLKSFRTLLNEADVPRLNSVLSRYPKLINDYETINPLAILVDGKDEYKSIKSAELLIKYKANVNGPVDAEQTPLIKATRIQKGGFASLFLAAKANPQLLDKEGKSALIHAIELNNLELVDLLLSFSAVEKYTFRRDGKKITYSACQVARNVDKNLTETSAKEINRQIRKSLACGFAFWAF